MTSESSGRKTLSRGSMVSDKMVGLFIPPAYDRDVPPLGTPALAGFLRSKGIRVFQRDLNILYPGYINKKRLAKVFQPRYRKDKSKSGIYYARLLEHESAHPSYSPWFEANPGTSFAFTERILSSRHLLRYIADREENHFIRFFEEAVSPHLKRRNCDVIGFSITSPTQVLAAFTFGNLVKKFFPGTQVVIGGWWVSFFREQLRKKKEFARFYDYAIYGEGETPFFHLITAIREKKTLSAVENLIYRDGGPWRFSPRVVEEDLQKLPAPDFDGLPLKKYLDSDRKLTLPIETSRGCYWNKCIFCADLPLPRPRYREKRPARVIREIRTLVTKYQSTHLMISNATFSPRQMREIARRLLEARIKISWWTFARFDEGFTKETLALAKEAGCSMMGFGLESINQRVLDFINKGTNVRTIQRIIKDAHDLKLEVYFQAIVGLPSESREEALDTIKFLATADHARNRATAFNVYFLTPKNEVFLNPEKYGIKRRSCGKLPFRYFYPYEHVTGEMDRRRARKLLDAYPVMRGPTTASHWSRTILTSPRGGGLKNSEPLKAD
jgi:radical SAM superfamily enzyme YgiQ (UPF0313 family)